ncbi:glycosyltransferase [Limnobacter parvus]|uniref:Glycosyltransferase n=1 Tax=Limnobacter parvus TaxID=2939690 RepID=A0ABT1XDK8_9BURK|nr:glycosyltransferase [Limnobacter parvus]MCR2745214.1 glycosyltransferase [Limnobacter parvus]
MKIYHFIDSLDPKSGGTSTFVESFISSQYFSGTNFTNIVVVKQWLQLDSYEMRFNDNKDPNTAAGSLQIKVINYRRLLNLFIKSKSERKSSFVMHFHGLWQPWTWIFLFIRKAGFLSNSIAVVQPHGMLQKYSMYKSHKKKKLVLQIFLGRLLNTANRFIFSSDKEALESLLVKSITIKSYVKINHYIPDNVYSKICDDAERFYNKELNVIFLGRLDEIKNIDVILKAFVETTNDRLILKIAGSGDASYEEYLKSLVSPSFRDRVRFLGFLNQEEKIKQLKCSDFIIMCSKTENFGLSLLEGVAAGCIPIFSDNLHWVSVKFPVNPIVCQYESLQLNLVNTFDRLNKPFYCEENNSISLRQFINQFSEKNILSEYLKLYEKLGN